MSFFIKSCCSFCQCFNTTPICKTSGKPSTWSPLGELVEYSRSETDRLDNRADTKTNKRTNKYKKNPRYRQNNTKHCTHKANIENVTRIKPLCSVLCLMCYLFYVKSLVLIFCDLSCVLCDMFSSCVRVLFFNIQKSKNNLTN